MQKIICLLACFSFYICYGQDQSSLEKLMVDDSTDVNTIAQYPRGTQLEVFELISNPQLITGLADIKKDINGKFKKLVSALPKSDQAKIYDLTRYEGLINEIISADLNNKGKSEAIFSNYSFEVRSLALDVNQNHRELLFKINDLNVEFILRCNNLVSAYPEGTRTLFRNLLKFPELVSILQKNKQMVETLGEIYKKYPETVKNKFDKLSTDLAEQKAKDNEEWKETIKNDPAAANEVQRSAQDYAKENGWIGSEFNETDPKVIENYHCYPYPIWVGFPWWYEYDYWYPYPYWYQSGFYYHLGGVVWIGQPSWYFMRWHFHSNPHFNDYPNLTNVYFNYYYGPRRAIVSNTVVVHDWVKDNRKNLPYGFLNKDENRIHRIREFGKLERDLDREMKNKPGIKINREEYISKHPSEYPHLQKPDDGSVKPVTKDKEIIAPAKTPPSDKKKKN